MQNIKYEFLYKSDIIGDADVTFTLDVDEYGTTWYELMDSFIKYLNACGFNVTDELLQEYVEERG